MKTRNVIQWICLLSILGIFSCESGRVKQTSPETKTLGSFVQFYQDSVYLSFEGNLHEPEIIWGHIDVYTQAYERLRRHLYFEGDTLNWDFKSAEEVKVSDNIYEYIIWSWSYDNNLLRTGDYVLVILKDGYYMIKHKKDITSKVITIIEGDIVLRRGAHESNMENCIRAFRRLESLRLPCVIDEKHSDLKSDGFGGRTIYGSGKSDGELWGYYVCDPCSYENRLKCDLNICVGFRTDDAGERFYEKAINKLSSPLMTLTNRRNFK